MRRTGKHEPKRNRRASIRRGNKDAALTAAELAQVVVELGLPVPGVSSETRAGEVMFDQHVGSLEFKTASETRHHSMPTPAELEADGWLKFYRDSRYPGAWMMIRKI